LRTGLLLRALLALRSSCTLAGAKPNGTVHRLRDRTPTGRQFDRSHVEAPSAWECGPRRSSRDAEHHRRAGAWEPSEQTPRGQEPNGTTSGMLFFVTWAENSRCDPPHKLRSFLACKETPKTDESRNYSGFDLNNFSRQIPIGYPFIRQSINQMEWCGTTVSISGYFYLSGMRVLERRSEANLGIIFAQASGSSILLVLFYQK